jgi:hypothetical protein
MLCICYDKQIGVAELIPRVDNNDDNNDAFSQSSSNTDTSGGAEITS